MASDMVAACGPAYVPAPGVMTGVAVCVVPPPPPPPLDEPPPPQPLPVTRMPKSSRPSRARQLRRRAGMPNKSTQARAVVAPIYQSGLLSFFAVVPEPTVIVMAAVALPFTVTDAGLMLQVMLLLGLLQVRLTVLLKPFREPRLTVAV